MPLRDDLTDVPGFPVGSAEDTTALPGCTVAPVGSARLGASTGNRDIDATDPSHVVQKCHAAVLTGVFAFGPDAHAGVSAFLESESIGFETRDARIPFVSRLKRRTDAV